MGFPFPLSLKAKFGAGLFISYASFEMYMHFSTQRIISKRKEEVQRVRDLDGKDGDGVVDYSKFKSATVAGMFVNPFEEYRPQTAFEFLIVRIMEIIESVYGSQYEIHEKVPGSEGREVEDMLISSKPKLDLLRSNSILLQRCIQSRDFSDLNTAQKTWNMSSTIGFPLRHQLSFTWLGQSCSLVQVSGINFLTDPIISNHLVNESLGPKRLINSPMSFEDIKYATNDKLDVVLVSHDHPDHLEMNFAKQIGNTSTWIVPLGLKKKLARKGIYNLIEMDWWDTINLNKYISHFAHLPDQYEVVCVPSMHWSGRYIFDSNVSLWCSFIVRRNGQTILYHAGDTGFLQELFDVIGKMYGPTFLSLLPIGQYCPSWHQKPRHISPLESIDIAKRLSSTFMMGIHWGTFKLSSEPILEPKTLLEKQALTLNMAHHYKAPVLGKSYVYNLTTQSEIDLI